MRETGNRSLNRFSARISCPWVKRKGWAEALPMRWMVAFETTASFAENPDRRFDASHLRREPYA
jgi:hypothetical protein